MNKQTPIENAIAGALIIVGYKKPGVRRFAVDTYIWHLKQLIKREIEKVEKRAVLDYIMSLGWQDTENEYVKEVLADADKLADELNQMKGDNEK